VRSQTLYSLNSTQALPCHDGGMSLRSGMKEIIFSGTWIRVFYQFGNPSSISSSTNHDFNTDRRRTHTTSETSVAPSYDVCGSWYSRMVTSFGHSTEKLIAHISCHHDHVPFCHSLAPRLFYIQAERLSSFDFSRHYPCRVEL